MSGLQIKNRSERDLCSCQVTNKAQKKNLKLSFTSSVSIAARILGTALLNSTSLSDPHTDRLLRHTLLSFSKQLANETCKRHELTFPQSKFAV